MFQGYGKFISLGKAIREQQQCSSSNICLIPFKAKAWLDLKERKLNGEQVDSKNIKKMPLANICGHGDVQVPTRDVVIKCCKKAGLKVEKFEIRKGMRMHCVVRKPMGKAIGNER